MLPGFVAYKTTTVILASRHDFLMHLRNAILSLKLRDLLRSQLKNAETRTQKAYITTDI